MSDQFDPIRKLKPTDHGHVPERGQPHPGPLAWQKFGDRWCLTGQYGMRPIVLSANPKGQLMLRDQQTDRLVPFDPAHPDARMLASAPDLFAALSLMEKVFNDTTPIDALAAMIAIEKARAAIERVTRP